MILSHGKEHLQWPKLTKNWNRMFHPSYASKTITGEGRGNVYSLVSFCHWTSYLILVAYPLQKVVCPTRDIHYSWPTWFDLLSKPTALTVGLITFGIQIASLVFFASLAAQLENWHCATGLLNGINFLLGFLKDHLRGKLLINLYFLKTWPFIWLESQQTLDYDMYRGLIHKKIQ